MQLRLLFFSFLICFSAIAQEGSSEKKITDLRNKIEKSQRGEKLVWLDSLSTYIVKETNFESDSMVRETVRYALELDSLRLATWHTANLIYFQNNIKGNPNEGTQLFESFLGTAKKIRNPNTLAKFYIEGADSYYFAGDHNTSVIYYNLAEVSASKANNNRFVGLAKLYKGGSLSFLGNFSEASQVLQEASKVFQESKDTFNIISAKNSLSILYSQNAFFKEAEAERDEAIMLATSIKSYGHLVSFYYNAATDAKKQGNSKIRIANLKKALEASRNTRNPDFYEPVLFGGMAIAYAQMDSIVQSEHYLGEFEKSPEIINIEKNRVTYVDVLKNLAFAKGEYKKALQYGKEHLHIKKNGTQYEEIQESEKFMVHVYEAIGDTENAFVHFKNFTAIKDSIHNVQKVKALSYYQTLYETEKRDAKIVAQKKDIALLDAKNEVKSQWIIFGGLGLLGLFGVVVLMRSRNAAKRRQILQEKFSQDLIKTQEEERSRVARELHDSVGQKLMLLTKKTKGKGDPEMESLADTTLEELRSVSRGLHPATLEKLGVTAAIRSLINEVDSNSNIFFTNDIENIDGMLSKDASLHLYRIIQEVLTNMVKHAEAKAASVTILKSGRVINTIIVDNGKGFDYSEKEKLGTSLGMNTLLERAKIIESKLNIKSQFNKGTTITLVTPT
jgi:signal transduction histidine kinase